MTVQPRRKVLIVDDAGPVIILCVNVLQSLGYAVRGFFENGGQRCYVLSLGASGLEGALDELSRSTIATDMERTQLLYGEWLRRARRRKEARGPLHEALEFFETIGASGFAARARNELAATGQRVRSRSAPVNVLTPQEAQIARLAASGERKHDIAAQLYITTSTVEYHLRKIFVKLGVSSRTQLAQVDLPT